MSGASGFQGHIAETYRDSTPWWPESAADAAAGRPNVIYIVMDDMGFGSLGCYGSEISTPNLDDLARHGVTFTNFHATALCSPTRASLLTGRNSHAVGMAYLSHVDDGYPGYRGRMGHNAATVAETLLDNGYNTMAVGNGISPLSMRPQPRGHTTSGRSAAASNASTVFSRPSPTTTIQSSSTTIIR